MESKEHKELKDRAIGWLLSQGCSVVSQEVGFRGRTYDAIGIKNNGTSYCVEAKATQSDLDKGRQDRLSYSRVFTFSYLIVSPELKVKLGNFEGWGIIRNGMVEKKARRLETDVRLSSLIDLIFSMAANLSWKVYQKSAKNEKIT